MPVVHHHPHRVDGAALPVHLVAEHGYTREALADATTSYLATSHSRDR